jgi:hypothetical protein
MAFKLKISFTGLCVFFPDNVTTDVVLVKTPGHHHSAHTATVTMIRGKQRPPALTLPFELARHDLYLYEGPTKIETATGTGSPHAFHNYPTLLPSVGNPPQPKPGVRPPLAIGAMCAARMRLFDGEFFGEAPTFNCWHLVDEATGSAIPKTEMDPMYSGFRYERTIREPFGRLECDGAGPSDFLQFEPENGVVHLVIGNYPHHDPSSTPGKDRSPHFGHVYDLFQSHGPLHALEECSEARKDRISPRGLNMPCVGGCTC